MMILTHIMSYQVQKNQVFLVRWRQSLLVIHHSYRKSLSLHTLHFRGRNTIPMKLQKILPCQHCFHEKSTFSKNHQKSYFLVHFSPFTGRYHFGCVRKCVGLIFGHICVTKITFGLVKWSFCTKIWRFWHIFNVKSTQIPNMRAI